MIGYHGPKATDAQTPALDVLQYALSAGEGAMLTQSLVYQQELAVNVMVDFGWRIDPGAFVIFAELNPKVKPEQADRYITAALERVARKGLAAEELTRAKNLLRSRSLRELATHNGRASALGTAEVLLGNWREAFGVIDRYGAVTATQVKKAAAELFESSKRSVVTLVPSA